MMEKRYIDVSGDKIVDMQETDSNNCCFYIRLWYDYR